MSRGFSGEKRSGDSVSLAESLQYVFVIFRHGKRSPMSVIPAFGDKKDNWPNGIYKLTSQGKNQMYNFGDYIRKRYAKYLSDDPREVLARSLTADRCFESISCLLAGAYPPRGDRIWHKDLNWQPIQILTDLSDMYEVLYKHKRDSNNVLIKAGMEDFSNELSKNSGGLDVTSSINLAYCVDNPVVLKEHGFPVSQWVEDNWDSIMEAESVYMDFLTGGVESFLVKQHVETFLDVLKSRNYNGKKIQMLCCSDLHLLALLKVFDSRITGKPPLGAALFVEVIRQGTSDFVEITYLPRLGQDMEVINVPHSSKQSIPVEDFVAFLESLCTTDS